MKKFLTLAMLMCAVVFFAGCGAINRTVEDIITGDYVIGTIDGNNFESEWLGLRFTAPNSFIMASQEEMLEMMQLGMDILEVDRAVGAWAEMAVVTEMMAMLPTGLANVTMATERVMLRNMTIAQYVDAKFQQMAPLGWGIDFNDDIEPTNFAGKEWYTYTANINALGLDWSYRYFIRRFDNRMALITIYSVAGEEQYIDILLNSFSAY